MDLATSLEIVSRVHQNVDTLVDRNHVDRDTLTRIGRTVVDNPETEVRLGGVRVGGLGWHQPESASSVERLWLAGEESGFLEVDFESLQQQSQ